LDEEIKIVEAKISATPNIIFLINNAGFGTRGRFADVDLEKHLEMIDVHVRASTRLTHAVLRQMIRNNEGYIINISSMAALLKKRGSPTYGGTKLFLNQFSLMLQNELKSTNIKVQALCPGYTHTEFHSVRDFEGFNKSVIPKFLWMEAEDVVDISLKSLNKKKVVIIPGFKNRIFLKLENSRILGRLLVNLLSRKRK